MGPVALQVKLHARALKVTEIKALGYHLGTLGATCLYRNTTTGQWQPDGVTQLSVTDGASQCVSDHLTEFAVVSPSLPATTSNGTGNSGTPIAGCMEARRTEEDWGGCMEYW